MPVAAIALDFEPVVRIADRSVRLESLVVAAGLLAALLLAARLASRRPGLRTDDLLYLALAAVPGAVVGGRLGYVLVHLDYYAARPTVILDPGQGSLQLGLGIVGGALTGGAAARLLGEPVGRWFDVAAAPLLLAIVVGKVGLALGGTGQGLATDVPWATSYLGDGPWGSLGPEIPSHPSQLYEAAATAILLGLFVRVPGVLGSRARSAVGGALFVVAVAGWAAIRLVVGATFREPPVLGPLRVDQLLALAILAGALTILALRRSSAPLDRADFRQGSIVGHPGPPASGSRPTEGSGSPP